MTTDDITTEELCRRCTEIMDPAIAGASRVDSDILICGDCCTAEAKWGRAGIDWDLSDWPVKIDDHIMSWADADHLVGFIAVLRGLGEEAAAEAVGADPESRADHAAELLRGKSVLAGYQLSDAILIQARADYLTDFSG
jgi:hypothetical protein